MNDYDCAEKCVAAARADIQRTLTSYFQLAGNTEHAEERANALLDHYDHQQAERIRASADGPGTAWDWWDASTIPGSIADLIDPQTAEAQAVTPIECICGNTSGIPHEHWYWVDRSPRLIPKEDQ